MNGQFMRIKLGVVVLLMIGALIGRMGVVHADAGHSTPKKGDASRTIIMTMGPDLRFAVDPSQEGVEVVSEEPLVIRIDRGTQVVFRNTAPFAHNVLHAEPENLDKTHGKTAFHSPEEMESGEEFTYTFDEEGTYPILCMYAGHYLAGMTATILVGDDPPSAKETFEAVTSDAGH